MTGDPGSPRKGDVRETGQKEAKTGIKEVPSEDAGKGRRRNMEFRGGGGRFD